MGRNDKVDPAPPWQGTVGDRHCLRYSPSVTNTDCLWQTWSVCDSFKR